MSEARKEILVEQRAQLADRTEGIKNTRLIEPQH